MSSGEETAVLLARVPMFASLGDRELAELAEMAVPCRYDAGEAVFREGERGETCFVIVSGAVRMTRSYPGGRAITLAELRGGEMFGELAMFDEEVRSTTAEALEPSTTISLEAPDVRRLLRRHPDAAVRLLAELAHRLREANERFARQAFQTVSGRVAGALLAQVAARQGDGGHDADVVVTATQAEIAQLAGSSRESASRFLAELERAGHVTTRRGKVVIHDPEALRNYIY